MKQQFNLIKTIFKKQPENNSITRIGYDLIKWLVKNRGKLYYFYVFGLQKKGSRMENFIYHPEFVKIRKQYDTRYFYPILEDKFMFDTLLKGLNYPTPALIGFIENYEFQLAGRPLKVPLEHILDQDMDVYCKLVYSWGGKNVFRLQVEKGMLSINGNAATIETLKKGISGGKYILQQTVDQHEDLNRMNPWCANTLRVITVTDGRKPGVLAAILRIGIDQNFVDNASGGNLQSGIGPDNRLQFKGSQWGYPPRYFEKHPESGIEIKGFEVPCMNEVRELCVNLHLHLNYFFIISWDIAISKTGPVVIEANPVPDIMPMQMQSHGFRTTLLEYADRFGEYRKTYDLGVRQK